MSDHPLLDLTPVGPGRTIDDALEERHIRVLEGMIKGRDAEIERLRARLAEAEALLALLREVSREGQDIGGNLELFARIDAALRKEGKR